MIIYFNNFLAVPSVGKGKEIHFFAKKSEACAIIYALKREKEFEYKNINLFLEYARCD